VAFEIVQKAVVAGLGGIVAVGGATSLAVDLAARAGLPLTGFVRRDRATWYVDAPTNRGP
jgi:FdhD protein